MIFRTIDQVWRSFKILAGFTLLLIGVVMVFTPGPGWLVIFLGLTLLAAEFVWARRLMDRMKDQSNRLRETVWKFGKPGSGAQPEVTPATANPFGPDKQP
jgi:tellurite resistance protein TerC